MIRSVTNIAAIGTRNAAHFLLKYAPPNKAIAAIGAKFGGCGSNLTNAAAKIINVSIQNLGVILLIYVSFLKFF
jgi:hypothetical protein